MAFLTKKFNSCLSGLWPSRRLERTKSGIEKLEKKMAKLRAKRDDVKNQIDEAECEGKISTDEVNQWLGEVEALERQVTDIEQVLRSTSRTSSQTQRGGDHVRICWFINRTVAKNLSKANELMSRVDALVPIATVEPHRPPVGIEPYVKDIVGYIDGGEDNIMSIYGMGGVGKTTILNSIQRHYLLRHTIFDHVIWIVASKDCQLRRLQMDIAKSLGLNALQENDDEQTCGYKLFNYLKKKKCLLFLDDIWEYVDLQLLGMAHSATEPGQYQQQQPRKVVVFTTRSATVCGQMKAEKKIKVKCLEPDEAWQLFQQNSDKQFLSSDGGINIVAHELAKECAGLPLALITVARAMLAKMSWEAWMDALHQIRDKHEWTTVGLSVDSLVMYKAFKLSYDSLENDSIRECLLCCALWPKDYKMDKFEDLIPCWIGCGIICGFNVINEAFEKGCSHLDALIAASLLEHCNRNSVKMHNVIREMALLMVSGLEGNKRKWIVQAGIGLSHLPRQDEWHEAERTSFMRNKITSLQEYGASTFPKLSMLILHHNRLKTIPPSLFASMPRLTYLDLCYSDIRKLPMEIGNLTELQYLNLSHNPITTLPAEFGCLCKLEHLLLRDTEIKAVPNGTISNLSMLKWLDLKGIHPAPEWWRDELKCFKGRHQLSVAIDIDATTANIELLNMLPNVSVWNLTIYEDDTSELPDLNLPTSQWSYNISDNLESLIIQSVKVDTLMFSSGHRSSFGHLKKLVFHTLLQLDEISLNGVGLCYLLELNILNCPKLKDVSWVLQLPCLDVLMIEFCPGIKELISDVGNSGSKFGIRSLTLSNMSNLNCIANQALHFPYFEYMLVYNCPKLKKLPFGTEISKNRLKEIEGDETWWHNLEWDDESDKKSLASHFILRQ